MERAAKWRGSPTASSKREFTRLISCLRPSRKDVFFDLGCGYGSPCIWIAPKVKLSVGIENHYYRYLRAKREAERSGFKNIRILWKDIDDVSYNDASLIYSVIYVGFSTMHKIQTQTKPGTRVILYGVPPYPLRSKKLFGSFHLFRTPFERVSDEEEFARSYLGRRKATLSDLMRSLDREQARDLRREIEDADSNWLMLRSSRIKKKCS